jgi:tetratricopeptide (TPR) repeat protein
MAKRNLPIAKGMNTFRKHFPPLSLLVLGILIIYSNSLKGSFQFDDSQIQDRPNLHITELNTESIKGTLYWTPEQKRIYRPLPCLTLGLNYYFGGDNPFSYHIVNVTIHILCAIAVYVFLQTLLSITGIRPAFAAKYRYEIAVIATFLFAFHPIQTNVATYIIQRMTSMAALFYIISVTGYIFFRKQTLSNGKGSLFRKYAGLSIALISGICSFLSKENAAILPVTILLLDYLFFYNLVDEDKRKKLKRVYVISIFLLMAVIAYVGTGRIMGYIHGYGHRDFSLIERLLTEPRIVFFYLYLLFIPNINLLNLSHDFVISKSIINPPQTFLAISGIAILLIAAFVFRKKHNVLSFAILWYLGNLVIESTIIPLELVFEHRAYLPGIMVFFLISSGIIYVIRSVLKNDKAILITSLLLILYGNGTYLRNFVFRTPISLWFDVAQKSPNQARAYANLGKAYADHGYYSEAKEAYEKAIEIKPDTIEPLINLGTLYLDNFGKKDQALLLIKKAQRLDSKSAFGCMALGNIYYKLEDYEKAEHYLSVAIDRAKFLVPAINCLGIVKIYLGKKNEAVNVFQYGISVDPEYEEFYFNLAKLYSNEKMFSDAIQILDKYLSGNRDSRKGKALLKVIKKNAQSINPVEE